MFNVYGVALSTHEGSPKDAEIEMIRLCMNEEDACTECEKIMRAGYYKVAIPFSMPSSVYDGANHLTWEKVYKWQIL